jgi:hypothetical protein
MLRITTFRPSATERTDAVKEQVSRTHEVGLASVGRGIDFVDLSPATADVEVAPCHGVGLAARHRAIQILVSRFFPVTQEGAGRPCRRRRSAFRTASIAGSPPGVNLNSCTNSSLVLVIEMDHGHDNGP